MPGEFNYEQRRNYPHLLGNDFLIWHRYVAFYPDKYDTVDYDVHVGSGITPLQGITKNDSEQWRALTQKRIDVVAWNGEKPTIIEVKHRVALDTLGQILGYQFLYGEEHPEYKNSPVFILCAMIGPDDISVLQHFKIPWHVVS